MIDRRDPLEPNTTIQKEALVAAVADIIWRAGSGQGVLCLPSKSIVYLPESAQFNQDGVTEKVLQAKTHTPSMLTNYIFNSTVAVDTFRKVG